MTHVMSRSLESALHNARARRPTALPADFAERVLRRSEHDSHATGLVVVGAWLKLMLVTSAVVAAVVTWGTGRFAAEPPAIEAFSKPRQFPAL